MAASGSVMKVAWWCAGLAVAAGVFGQSFEVASVKRDPDLSKRRMNATAGGLNYVAVPLQWVVAEAYSVPFRQVLGPEWIEQESYDVFTKAPAGSSAADRRAMLQTLLTERFHLKAHRDTRDMQALVMTVAKGGAKLHASDQRPRGYQISQDGAIRHMKVPATMTSLAPMLAGLLREPVVDRTELTGVFDIAVDWDVSTPAESTDNLLRAVEGQLGLKIERKKIPLEVVVVDHADKEPVEN